MRKTIWTVLMVALVRAVCLAQVARVDIAFVPVFNGYPVELNKNYYLPAINDSVSIETLKFYVADIMLIDGDREVGHKGAGYYLVDIAEPGTQKIDLTLLSPKKVDAVQLAIGIDSITNASGAQGGALDPMNGMYWAWQSGYINFKLEGSSAVCPTRNHFFQYHIGGYMPPHNPIQYLLLPVDSPGNATVYIHVDRLLAGASLSVNCEIMSPGAKAMRFSELFQRCFTATSKP